MELILWTVLKLPHKPVWPTGFPACLICRWHFIRVRWEAEQRGMCQIGELCKRYTKKNCNKSRLGWMFSSFTSGSLYNTIYKMLKNMVLYLSVQSYFYKNISCTEYSESQQTSFLPTSCTRPAQHLETDSFQNWQVFASGEGAGEMRVKIGLTVIRWTETRLPLNNDVAP